MAVTLTINGQSIEATPGSSLFDTPKRIGIDVPTSCRKQGKCKECMVEVVEGMSAALGAHRAGTPSHGQLPPVVPGSRHRRGRPRPLPHHAPRADAHRAPRIRTAASAIAQLKLDPAVTREGDRILIDGVEVERSTGPIYGLAMDLGTTTVVLRLSISKPANWWPTPPSKIRSASAAPSDVAHRIRHATIRADC